MKRNSSRSSNGYALDRVVRLKGSLQLGIFYLFVHLGGLVSVLVVSIPLLPRIGLVIAICTSLVSVWRHHVSRTHPCAVLGLRPSGSGFPGLILRDRPQEAVKRIGPVFVHPRIVLAAVATDRGSRTLVVPWDATSVDEFHRLRVFLRTRRGD